MTSYNRILRGCCDYAFIGSDGNDVGNNVGKVVDYSASTFSPFSKYTLSKAVSRDRRPRDGNIDAVSVH